MSYINKILHPQETVVFRTRLHWIVFLKPAICLLIALALAITITDVRYSQLGSLFLVFFVLPYTVSVALSYFLGDVAVTNQRLIARTGFRHSITEVVLHKIERIEVEHGLLGGPLNYGHLNVIFAGGARKTVCDVRSAEALKQALKQQMGSHVTAAG